MGNTDSTSDQAQVQSKGQTPPKGNQAASPQRASHSPNKQQNQQLQQQQGGQSKSEHQNLMNSRNIQWAPLVTGTPMGQVIYYVQDQHLKQQPQLSQSQQQNNQSPINIRIENANQPPPPPQIPIQGIINQQQQQQQQQLSLQQQQQQQQQQAQQGQQGQLQSMMMDTFSYFKVCTQQQFQEGNSYYLMRKQKDSLCLPNQQLQQRSRLSHPHLVKTFGINNQLINAILNQKDDSQGIYFEYLNTNLRQLILERKASQLFTQGDLVSLLKGLTSSLAYLQEHNVFHGDISPETIYFDENSGLFKIADEEIISGEFQCFYQTRLRNRIGFISPELIPPIRNPNILEVKENFFKADVFSLGLTLLEAATLKRSTDIYDIKEMTIFPQIFYERIYFISAYYSAEFTHAVRLMLEVDPQMRPDFIQLFKLLNQKVPKQKRKVAWPPVPVGLPPDQKKNKNNQPIQQKGQPIIIQNQQSEEYIQSNEQSPTEFSPKQHPRMLTAMPQKALERIEELNEKLNKLQLFQKPLENIQQHSSINSPENNKEKVLVAAFQPNQDSSFTKTVEIQQQQQSQQQSLYSQYSQPQQQQFQLKSLMTKIDNDKQTDINLPIKQIQSQQYPNVNLLQKTPDQQVKFSGEIKERQSSSTLVTDFSLTSQKIDLAQSDPQYLNINFKEEDRQKRLGTSMNVLEEKSHVTYQQNQKQSNFRDAVDKIKAELSETKKLIENYHKKTEQLKKDLHFANEKF